MDTASKDFTTLALLAVSSVIVERTTAAVAAVVSVAGYFRLTMKSWLEANDAVISLPTGAQQPSPRG